VIHLPEPFRDLYIIVTAKPLRPTRIRPPARDNSKIEFRHPEKCGVDPPGIRLCPCGEPDWIRLKRLQDTNPYGIIEEADPISDLGTADPKHKPPAAVSRYPYIICPSKSKSGVSRYGPRPPAREGPSPQGFLFFSKKITPATVNFFL
jgi:hypothetical protein